ncbi:MAG: hypothetical protein J6V72_22270 [Kiritimatiellae bacterium]|nr:hypothetical protein [Kiritimatiellia bacterium]
MPISGDAIFPTGALCLGAGFLFFLVLWIFLPAPVRVYVLGHELTHALWGLLFGARPSNLKVGLKGGSVTLTKTNVWITLAPYFFPFWTAVVGLFALVVRCFVSPLPFTGVWLFAVGFTWCLHVCFTLRSLLQSQPDIQEYGYVFSYVFIWIFNIAGVIAWIVCTSEVTWGAVWTRLAVRSARAYGLVGRGFLWIYESVRTLL